MPFQSIILGFGDELCKSYLTDFKFLKIVIRKTTYLGHISSG